MNNKEKGDGKYQRVLLENVETEGQSVREKQDDDHVVELAMSLARIGLLEPIVVAEKGDGKYQLIAGFHRLAAATRLKWSTIPAHIRAEDDTPLKALALTENIIRRDLSLEEECQSVDHLHNVEKLSPSSICDLLGKSRAWVDRRLAAPNLPVQVRTAVFEGTISVAAAEFIGAIENEGVRNTILNQTIYGKLTNSQVQDLIRIYETAPNIEEAVQAGLSAAREVQDEKVSGQKCAACGIFAPYQTLMPVWICRHGCRPVEHPAETSKAETK